MMNGEHLNSLSQSRVHRSCIILELSRSAFVLSQEVRVPIVWFNISMNIYTYLSDTKSSESVKKEIFPFFSRLETITVERVVRTTYDYVYKLKRILRKRYCFKMASI